jgi:hypothetical protein
VQTLGSGHPDRKRGGRRSRRVKAVSSPPSTPDVPVTRATVADSEPFEDEAAAGAWLKALARDPKARAAKARIGLDVLNRALETLRRHADDPLVGDASFHHALVIRIGYGIGEEVADGAWTAAHELPSSPSPRHADLDAQRKTAIELAGRDPEAEAAEEAADRKGPGA